MSRHNHNRQSVRPAVLAVAVTVIAAMGCGFTGRDGAQPAASEPPPCGGNGVTVHLGTPTQFQAPRAAEFTTDGEAFYLTAYDFETDFLLNRRPEGVVYYGPAGTTPTFDHQRGILVPAPTTEARVSENRYTKMQLPAGTYWVFSTRGPKIDIICCTPGAITGKPQPRPDLSPTPS